MISSTTTDRVARRTTSLARPARRGFGLLIVLLFSLPSTNPYASGTSTLAGEDGLRAFKRAFRESKQPEAQLEARKSALRALQGDSPEIANVLLKASISLENEAEALEEERASYLGKSRSDRRLQRRESLDPLRELQGDLRRRLLALRNAEALDVVVKAALQNDKLPFTTRLALVERARDLPMDVRCEATGTSLRSRKRGTLVVALRTIIADEDSPAEFLPALLKLVGHDSVVIRELAAEALCVLPDPRGVEVLVRRIVLEEGRTRQRLADALQILTGQPIGDRPAAWVQWWQDHQEEVRSGDMPLGGGVIEASELVEERYHGIPVDGNAILYVFDRSLSMRVNMGSRFERGVEQEPGKERRIDRAKSELIAALGSLSASKTFNIVVFAAGSKGFAEEMVDANPRNIKKAQQWVEDLKLEIATALYDGIDYGFVTGGRPARDQLYLADFDTMFVLTDGMPTIPAGAGGGGPGSGPGAGQGAGGRRGGRLERDSDEALLDAVRRWNVLGRVVIHTIGIGDRFDESLLENLARNNGGRFVSER